MTIKEYVLANHNADEYYQKRFPSWNPRSRPNQICIWHSENRPSLSVGLKNGGARCHGCGKRIGNIIHFEAEAHNISEALATQQLYADIRPCLTSATVKSLQRNVDKRVVSTIRHDCGLIQDTIEKFSLGLDTATRRVTIPIADRWGNWTNIRYFKLPSHRSNKDEVKIYNRKGHGYLELYPWPAIQSYTAAKPLFFLKAERDTLLAIQLGLQAFTVTGAGEDVNLEEHPDWLELFEDFEIGLCGDNDATGIRTLDKKFAILQNVCKFSAIIPLPFRTKSSRLKDFSDWILLDGGTKSKFLEIWKSFKAPIPKQINGHSQPIAIGPKLPEYYAKEYQALIKIGRSVDMLNTIVRTKGVVSAKTDTSYSIPYKFQVSSTASPKRDWAIPVGRELLRLVRTSDDKIIDFIKKDLLHAPRCKLEPTEYISVSEVEVIPVITPGEDAPYTTQRCFFFGERIEANVPYELEIIPTSEIRTQETVGLITKARPIASQLDDFVPTNDELSLLDTFRPEEEGVFDSLCNIANEVASQYTRIYNRPDWHICALLTWGCPIQFNFPNEGIQRGWLNTLALGDTQTGKSQVAVALQRLFNAGTFVSSENCTFVGLVGGAVKMGSGQFMLRWGKIPLANRQLVVLEELSGLSITDISNMSEVRSSGIARLDKGGLSSETSARTRLLCLSNVRGRDKDLASYLSGVKAIQDLVGHAEDIARFDLICTLTDKEVASSVINTPLYNQSDFHTLDDAALKLLIRFIWALKPDQIEVTKGAYMACLEQTKRLASIYHASVPIFKAGSGRLKIARVACAIACFQFHWDGKKIVVTKDHVEAAVALLQMVYDKPSLGYAEYSDQMFWREFIKNKEALDAEFQDVLRTRDKQQRVLRYLIHAAKFTRDELCSVGAIQIVGADRLIAKFIGSNLLRKGEANVWEITPIGKLWMQEHLKK